jgi:hypothetical protein
MTLVETQNAGNAFVVVRGISQARNSEPSVAVLVDGVLESNPAEFNQELFDIDQIEVLKGRRARCTAQRHRRRHHHPHRGPGRRVHGRVKLGAAMARRCVRRPASAADRRHLQVPREPELLRHRRLSTQHLPRWQGRSVETSPAACD